MEMRSNGYGAHEMFEKVAAVVRKCAFRVLSVGPIPSHIAFIMDGNRRYAKKKHMNEGSGHKAGFTERMSMLKYYYEFGVRYVTIYAFSIDNFKRHPEEFQSLMNLMQERIEGFIKEESIVNRYGVRVYFVGDLKLLNESVRLAADKTMAATATNSRAVLLICIASTYTKEIVDAVRNPVKKNGMRLHCWMQVEVAMVLLGLLTMNGKDDSQHLIKLADIEKHMHMSVAPSPDILICTSGETRLSNFLLSQSTYSYLYSPSVLWPEIGFRHFFWAILNYQRNHFYLEKKRKQS